MKEENFIGFIFTGYEILYLAKCMGAESIIGMQLNDFKKDGRVLEEAEKSLIRKNYVFKDFNGGLIFNKELVKYFEPVVLCESYAACSIRTGGSVRNIGCYINKDDFVCMDSEPLNKDNFVLTYKKGLGNLFDSIFREIDIPDAEAEEETFLSFAFIKGGNIKKPGGLVYRINKEGILKLSEGEGTEEVKMENIEADVRREIKNLIKKSDERKTKGVLSEKTGVLS